MDSSRGFLIRNEDDAWEFMRRWLAGSVPARVAFEDWPVLRISLKGGGYSSSLNSRQMAALYDLRQTVGRTYSAIAHGAYDMRRLKVEEEEKIDFVTSVKKGSSITSTDLTPLVHALSSAMTAHPEASLAAAVLLGLALVAKPIILKHYETKAKEIDADERKSLLSLALTSREAEQYNTFEAASNKLQKIYPSMALIVPDAASAFWRLAAASSNAESMTISGIQFSREDLAVLSERRKARPIEKEVIDDEFDVIGITKINKVYRVQIRSAEAHVSAIFAKPELTERKIRQLMACMTGAQSIKATIEVRRVDKSQVSARLMNFVVIPLRE